jgi:transcriptional regulator with XRE-family HTH domain
MRPRLSITPLLPSILMIINPGKNLRHIRERLLLKYRDVEEASQLIATRHKNPEFLIGLSRLADIENKGTIPSIYRMYSLAAIYGFDYSELLATYEVSLQHMPRDVAELQLQVTRPVGLFAPRHASVEMPQNLGAFDFRRTSFLSRQIQAWGLVPLQFLETLCPHQHRHAFVGTDDWSMHPIVPPGSFIQIDETKRKVMNSGWDSDFSRPIYLLELREGYRLGWCTERAGTLIVQPHSSAPVAAEVFKHPGEVEVVGQVVGVAMRLDRAKQRRKRSS